tara:strand:+ start:360 stop:473 length:114 start_codon:yes stop_codon:yes gene_type:complete
MAVVAVFEIHMVKVAVKNIRENNNRLIDPLIIGLVSK